MKTSKFRAKRQELLADATFRAKVAREKVLMAELDVAAGRQETGLTQEAVAAALGKSQENVSRSSGSATSACRLSSSSSKRKAGSSRSMPSSAASASA